MKDEEKVKLAQKFMDSLSKLKNLDMALLIRTNWILGGIIIGREKKETIYGDRVMLKVVKPDGRITYEYADRLTGGTLESCIFEFKDVPIILTERKVPSMMDDSKLFHPIITGMEARMWSELVADINIKHQIIHHQGFLISSLKTQTEFLESKLSALGSEIRQLKDENRLLRQENTELKRAVAQIKKIAEMAIRENITKDAIIKKIMDTLDRMSTKIVQTPSEVVEEITDMFVKTKSKMEVAVAGNGNLEDLRGELAKLKKLEEDIESLKRTVSDLPNIIKSVLKEHGGSS